MSTAQTYLAFCVVSIMLIYISVRIRSSWSRDGFTNSRYRRAVGFIMLSSFFHYSHAHTGEILFSDVIDKSPLRLISFILVFVHLGSLPGPLKKPWWFSRKKDSETIKLKTRKPLKNYYYEELFFQVLRVVVLVALSAMLLSGIFFLIVSKVIPGSAPFSNYSIITVFICFALLDSIYLYRAHKKRRLML